VLPTSFLAPGAPPAEREALLKAAGQTGEQYSSPTNVTLIRAGSDLILVDMGSGDRFMPTAGKLWDNLKAAGIDRRRSPRSSSPMAIPTISGGRSTNSMNW
jgi:hypothetical protein